MSARWISLRVLICLITTTAACGSRRYPVASPAHLAPQLPVTRVTLYQNGIGYFEHEGRLSGDLLTLHCKPHQINDLLKSLTVIDRGSGRPVSVSLPLEQSRSRVLQDLPEQVRHASGLLDILRVFRGARVQLVSTNATVSGRVVGVEPSALVKPGHDKGGTSSPAPLSWRVTVKDDRGQLLVLPVEDIRKLVIQDRALELGLERSLDASLQEGSWKPVRLAVRLGGGHSHDLLVSYIVEMPLWKPAYRLILAGAKRKPLLQGWAVIDNVSGESWNGVRLSLVAGTPMSFRYDLHSPRFVPRTDLSYRGAGRAALAPPEEQAGYANDESAEAEAGPSDALPRSYAKSRLGSSAAGNKSSRRRSKKRRRPARSRRDDGGAPPSPILAEPSAREVRAQPGADAFNRLLEKNTPSAVQGEKVGALFRYDLKHRVTVPDRSSTLVNLVNARVPGEDAVLFRPELTRGGRNTHPYRAVRFENASGFALERGPVAIYDEGAFVGEGFLERMDKGQTLFLAYAIDRTVSMTRSRSNRSEPIKLIRFDRGAILTEMLDIRRGRYEIQNHHEKSIVAYVKSNKPSGYSLRKPPEGTVLTATAAYVPLRIEPKKTGKLIIEWQSPVKRHLSIDTDLATSALKLYLKGGKVPESIRPLVEKVLARKRALSEIATDIREGNILRRRLEADQNRVRENLNLLRRTKGNAALKQRLTRSLAQLETKLSRLTARYVALNEKRARIEAELRALVSQISLTPDS